MKVRARRQARKRRRHQKAAKRAGIAVQDQSSIIYQYYPRVAPLFEYIKQTFGIDVTQVNDRDKELRLSPEERKNLQTTLVGVDGATGVPPAFVEDDADVTIREAVLSAQVCITSRAGTFWESQKNVLAKGYAQPEIGHDGFKTTYDGKIGLINRFPNSMVTKLVLEKQYFWLFSRIGPSRFTWLLANTSLFAPINGKQANGSCYIQLTGRSLSEARKEVPIDPVPASQESQASVERRLKRKRKKSSDSPAPKITEKDPAKPLPREILRLPRTRGLERVDSIRSTRSEAVSVGSSKVVAKANIRGPERKLSQISIVRSRIFYARASRNEKGAVDIGLPAVHVLNRSKSEKELNKSLSTTSSKPKRGSITAVKRRQTGLRTSLREIKAVELRQRKYVQSFPARRTRHLSKYVFPRQYNMHNVFTSERDFSTTTQPFKDYTVRETEIKERGPRTTPKRIRSILPILAKVIARHDRLNYRVILDRCCPSTLPKRKLTDEDKVKIVQDLAEAQTLRSNSDPANISPNAELHDAPELQPSGKPRYTNYAVGSIGQVVHFVTVVIKSLLPQELFGSAHNQRLVLNWVGRFVRLRRFETFSLHQIFQSFRLSDVEWNLPRATNLQRPTAVESNKRRELVLEVLYWIMDSLVIPLIRTCFYVTESAAYRNRTLYFRQDDWAAISKPVLLHLRQSIFEPISRANAVNIMGSRKLGYSHVRLLPKETGVRPIVNLRRRSAKQFHPSQADVEGMGNLSRRGKSVLKPMAMSTALAERLGKTKQAKLGRSINQILQSTFHILTYEKNRLVAQSKAANDEGMLSSAIFGQNDIYRHLKRFKHQVNLESVGQQKKKLYFVKVDVRCAFDSIDQGKLLEILEQILSHQGHSYDGYRIHRFAKVMAGKPANASTSSGDSTTLRPSIKRKFASLAQPDSTHLDFCDLASSLATALHDIVFVDNVAYTYEDTSFVLALLRDHVTANLIKIGRDYYRQKVGIPQGSSLSTLLCNFFYADMEAHSPEMAFLRESDQKGLLLRYTDDFLYMTTSKTQAKKFYNVMHDGHPTYGCFISPDKTLVNFDFVNKKAKATENPLVPRIPGSAFPWCGMTINTKDLGVETDLMRYKDVDMRDTLTVETAKQPGQTMVAKLLQSIKARCHVLFTDTALNGEARAYTSIYTGFVVSALKLVAYLGELRKFKMVFDADYIFKAVQKLVRFTSRYIATRATLAAAKVKAEKAEIRASTKGVQRVGALQRKVNRAHSWQVSCAVQGQYIHWLGYAAFLAVINPHTRAGTAKREADARRRSAIDPPTRAKLVTLLESTVYKRSYARKRMLPHAQSALTTARDILDF